MTIDWTTKWDSGLQKHRIYWDLLGVPSDTRSRARSRARAFLAPSRTLSLWLLWVSFRSVRYSVLRILVGAIPPYLVCTVVETLLTSPTIPENCRVFALAPSCCPLPVVAAVLVVDDIQSTWVGSKRSRTQHSLTPSLELPTSSHIFPPKTFFSDMRHYLTLLPRPIDLLSALTALL